ncbi:anti-sigma factor family protein [Sinorhizobium meliloti]|jgi:anti-sigma factor RsiW|uniref:Transmembrane anti-sigma factor n=5 Tax=Rhizobium meliloti TaxID=382 RepID=F7X8Y4_SINMM|nr:anti-sigma factor [Sinorhizobium meliloti]PST22827.1 anti-sigma factor [Mesorhizobium loti]TWA88196.1 anti-sigma factor RsiW [Ensifer sp. SEMIA 134]TWB23221.1 anti-sigma factor RsiW [Ensifer sp. SEMIA 135]AEG05559.1 putative transmembrane anti-sigma factor [Sinorhizobium meliloti BL225C]AEG54594.1 putative transmembrane anti-sigma factor [Sinorhizobium meliloti AK83]
MTENDLNPDILSAYVDGELEPEEASRVARLIASDEAVARRAAKLSEMKAAVAGMAPEIVVVTVPRPRPASRWMLSFAAGACASLLVFAVAWFGLARAPVGVPAGLPGDAAVRDAVLEHAAWVGGSFTPPMLPASAPADVFVPAMNAAGLTPVFARETSVNGEAALHTGYVGSSGCRLSLFRIARPDVEHGFDMSSDDGLLHASWSGDAASFLLVARGMDEARFALLAGALKLASEENGRGKQKIIASLGAMRQPCIG